MTDNNEFGWEHWFGPITPHHHELGLVPHSVIDGWSAHCSCGKWRSFASFWKHSTKEELLGELRKQFDAHFQEAANND